MSYEKYVNAAATLVAGTAGENPEYERGMAELIMMLLGKSADDVPVILRGIHRVAYRATTKKGVTPALGSPAVYHSFDKGIMTTGVYLTDTQDSNLREQLEHEICQFENEDPSELMICKQVDRWTVHVKGRFAPIGEVHAIAMLDPDWRA